MTLNFGTDLYRGTAEYYDRFRRPYPAELIDDLAARTGADGTGRLLDLACGTGQVCFALRGRFAEIWAVDQEPHMISLVRHKAAALSDPPRFEFRTEAAENLTAPEGSFDLVAMGNAFHRLRAALEALTPDELITKSNPAPPDVEPVRLEDALGRGEHLPRREVIHRDPPAVRHSGGTAVPVQPSHAVLGRVCTYNSDGQLVAL